LIVSFCHRSIFSVVAGVVKTHTPGKDFPGNLRIF
jgi:hypothetical protein